MFAQKAYHYVKISLYEYQLISTKHQSDSVFTANVYLSIHYRIQKKVSIASETHYYKYRQVPVLAFRSSIRDNLVSADVMSAFFNMSGLYLWLLKENYINNCFGNSSHSRRHQQYMQHTLSNTHRFHRSSQGLF